MHSLKLESETAVKLLSENKMTVKPDKFKAILISKNKSDYVLSGFSIGNGSVTTEQSVRGLGIDLDNQLNLNLYIRKIFKSAFNHLNALVKRKSFLRFGEEKILTNSFILSNFEYFHLFCLSHLQSLSKVLRTYKKELFDFYLMVTIVILRAAKKVWKSHNKLTKL